MAWKSGGGYGGPKGNAGGGGAGGIDKGMAGNAGGGNGAKSGGVSPDRLKAAYEQYSRSMMGAPVPQANLAGPHGYNGAVDRYNNRSGFWDALDWIGGPFIDVNKPDPTVPASFARGDFHTSTNPLGAVGALAGLGLGIPGLGFIGSQIGTAAGIPDIYHGGAGYSNTASAGGSYNTAAGSQMAGGGGRQGSDGRWERTPRAPAVTPVRAVAPAGAPQAPSVAAGPMSGSYGPKQLSVPGANPYGLMMPGYQWSL